MAKCRTMQLTSSQSSEASEPDLSCPLAEAPLLLSMRSARAAAKGSALAIFLCEGKGLGGARNFCAAITTPQLRPSCWQL